MAEIVNLFPNKKPKPLTVHQRQILIEKRIDVEIHRNQVIIDGIMEGIMGLELWGMRENDLKELVDQHRKSQRQHSKYIVMLAILEIQNRE